MPIKFSSLEARSTMRLSTLALSCGVLASALADIPALRARAPDGTVYTLHPRSPNAYGGDDWASSTRDLRARLADPHGDDEAALQRRVRTFLQGRCTGKDSECEASYTKSTGKTTQIRKVSSNYSTNVKGESCIFSHEK